MEPIIKKLGTYRFSVQYGENEPLMLNFEPLVREALRIRPCKVFALKHWQARPRGERRFGVFTQFADGSTSYTAHKDAKVCSCIHLDLQIPEGPYVPSAALYYPHAIATGGVPVPRHRQPVVQPIS